MKKHINKIVLVLAIIMVPAISFAQYCNHFHEDYCYRSENKMYSFNGQSKSALFSMGQTSELSVIVYAKQDYRISLCIDGNLGEEVKFKIYETNKVKVEKVFETESYDGEILRETKVVTEKQKQLIYDNSEDDFSHEIEFSVETTRRLTIEITVPGGGGDSSSKKKGRLSKSADMGCVGILVEHMTTPKSGFYGTGF